MSTKTGNCPWCEERLGNPAEDLYLARLFSPPSLRADVTAIAAIYVELEATTTRFRDLNVARTKLAWWHEEFARLAAGRPAHPATRLLGADGAAAAVNGLADMVTGAELNLLAGPARDLAGAGLRAERGFARLVTTLGLRLDPHGSNDYSAFGRAVGLARALSPEFAPETHSAVAEAACAGLLAERAVLASSPPTLRVLGVLAWRRSARLEAVAPGRKASRRRVFVAWRAARGKPPRALRARRGA